jgi:thiamine pyrophosphate-dependent acetolactate synthase large subunit-like protein
VPADFSILADSRGTRHSSVNLLLALFKASGLKPVSFRLSTGANHLADGYARRQGV